ncbi:helix-turn-helix domain-containing protein [Crenobacter sp. SG2305]|uniref:AraC family transcriptional regulator n=1 Tax=Crenobacter oryzisoli TaxID=3056844 RepID=UPI0025AAC20A|nr:helix-turn-helix domain-containing protein [Crenobacter sp. SG2305]MDN0083203.1 helix-turn-helix domain-containing protein [Crenobacter sp. SG2305]
MSGSRQSQGGNEHRGISAQSHDLDSARDWMASICGPHGLEVQAPQRLQFQHSGNVLRSMATTLGYVEYGTDVTIVVRDEAPLNCYSVSLPLVGQQELSVQGQLLQSNQDKGLILSPLDSQALTIAGDCRKIIVAIPRPALRQVLEGLLQRPLDAPLVFQPEMDAVMGDQAGWWRMVKFLLGELERTGHLFGSPFMASDLEHLLLKGLLLSQPHNYSAELANILSPAYPHYLLRARQYIHDNAREDLCLEDIEREAGVTRFKLFEAFKRYFGLSPMAYLKKYRLEAVRRELLADQSERNISTIAMSWGFTHLGRFSSDYKKLFDEMPSQTLSRVARR